jgi:hypothetical protein
MEGMWFTDYYCDRCWWDRKQDCEILAASLWYDFKDPRYPKEWVIDQDDFPRCTRWTDHEPKELPWESKEQLRLF